MEAKEWFPPGPLPRKPLFYFRESRSFIVAAASLYAVLFYFWLVLYLIVSAYVFPMDWQLIVPEEKGWDSSGVEGAWEVRLRPGQPVLAAKPGGVWRGSHILTPAEVTQAAQALCGHEMAARQRELTEGFLPLPGGHRLGVCGVMGLNGLREVTSLCVRLAHEVKGAGECVFPLIRGFSTLIAGPPGAGKTTMLRDIVRLYSLWGIPVGVADERGEIAACRDGMPQLDVGPMTDVVTGMEKAAALRLLVRSMAPKVAAVDEIGGEGDAAALREVLRCGVTVLATIHGRNFADIRQRRGMENLLEPGAFERVVCLTAPGAALRVTGWNGEEIHL